MDKSPPSKTAQGSEKGSVQQIPASEHLFTDATQHGPVPLVDPVEVPTSQQHVLQELDAEKVGEAAAVATADPYLVTFEGLDDPSNPYNWSQSLKWIVVLLVSLGDTITLMSSTMVSPALGKISADLRLDDATMQMVMTIFVLAFVIGPMCLAPMTEVFGRKPVWILSACFYLLWNTVCGFARSGEVLIVARFFAGIGSSVQYAVTNPILADCWTAEQRGTSFAIANLLPLLGPAAGPILGGVLTGSVDWRWLFWALSLFDAVIVLATLVVFRETYAPAILRHKSSRLRKQTGLPYYTEQEKRGLGLGRITMNGLARPWMMLMTNPLIQVMSINLAYNYGILYIVQSTFASLWTERYNQSVTVSGLHYIALVTGCTIAGQGGARLTDRIWRSMTARADGETRPEFRVPLMAPGNVLIVIGLFWYGWSAQALLHWIMPDIGIAIFGCGIILGTQAMQQYVMDAFPECVASAIAASQLPRNIAGFGFPLFAPALYHDLGYGWGNSVLAFIFIGIATPMPLILWKYGAKLRNKGNQRMRKRQI